MGLLSQNYCPDDGADLELVGIDGAPLFNSDGSRMTITLLGEDSDVAAKARNAQGNRRIQQGQRAKLTMEGVSADGALYLAKLTMGWNIEGQEFSQEAAQKLYLDRKMGFVVEQVRAFVEDRTNFLRAS